MQWEKFAGRFFLWLLAIPLNVVPIIFKQLRSFADAAFPGIQQLAFLTIKDFDFSFISISVLFVLCLEGFFVEDKSVIRIYRKFQLGSFIYFVAILILYCVFFFRPGLFSLMSEVVRFWYNIVLIGATVVLGVLCNGAISMKASVIA